MTEPSLTGASKSKKKRNGKPRKTALCSPYETFKPLLNDAQAEKINELLKLFLHQENGKTKLPWKKLIKLPKEVRKERVEEIKKKIILSEELQNQRKSLKFGLNSVARAIQHCHLTSCLLTGDVKPMILIDHLITLAITHGIPVLIVPQLKTITHKIVGFPCIALGLMAKEENHYLKPLDEEIRNMFLEFKQPTNYACVLKTKEKLLAVREKFGNKNKVKQKLKRTISNQETSSKKLPCTENSEHQFESLDFISLNSDSSNEVDFTKPRIDLTSVYMLPKFKHVSQNPDKFKKRKRKKE